MIALLSAILTILGPLLAAGVTAWVTNRRKDSIHATADEVDAYITQHLAGNPSGLISLARTLERLRRAASRKGRHS